MTITKNNGRDHVVGLAVSLEFIGHDFARSALLLYESSKQTNDWGKHIYSFNLLASQALEILPKSLIATRISLKNNNKSTEEIQCVIEKELSCLGHKLDNILNEVPELKEALKISNITRVNGSILKDVFIDEFRFTINDSGKEKEIHVKNLEGARYGMFARNKDLGGSLIKDMENMADFLNNLMNKIVEIRVSFINQFDKDNNV